MTTYWRVVDLDQNPVEAKEGKVKPTADPEVMAVFKNALRELKAAGAEIVDPQTLPDYRSAPRTYYTCLNATTMWTDGGLPSAYRLLLSAA